MENETPKEEKTIKAKSASLWGQIIAALWVAGWTAYKFITSPVDVNDIIFSGLAIAGCFSPVYFSLMLDKIKDIKWGQK